MNATAKDGRPIHDPVAERWVVVSILKDLSHVPQVVKILDASMFVDQDCRQVFSIIAKRFKAGERYDAFAVSCELERSGYCDGPRHSCLLLIELAHDIPTSAHCLYYSAVVKDLAQRRQLQGACIDTIRDLAQGWKPTGDITASLGEVLKRFEQVYIDKPAPPVKLPKRRRRAG